MYNVKQGDDGYIEGNYVAGCDIMYGALVARESADTVKGTNTTITEHDYIGVAIQSDVEGDTPGFYEQYDPIPIKTEGAVNLWLIGGTTATGGTYLRKCTTKGAGTEYLGVVAPEATATARTLNTIARVIGGSDTGDVGSTDYDQALESDAAGGQKTVTLTSAKISSLDISAGDYVVIDDDNAAEVNRVAAVNSATLTMQKNLSNSYTTAATATIYKLCQVKAVLV